MTQKKKNVEREGNDDCLKHKIPKSEKTLDNGSFRFCGDDSSFPVLITILQELNPRIMPNLIMVHVLWVKV
jgi:hypothetical protein